LLHPSVDDWHSGGPLIDRNDRDDLSRRRFLKLVAATAALGASGGALPFLASCGEPATAPRPGNGRSPLQFSPAVSARDAVLTPAPGSARIAPSESSAAWLYNGVMPGPTLVARKGDRARIRLVNSLAEPTIVHWHGLIVPAPSDGHPRDAIDSGATFDYDFPIIQRSGTFWYHPHPHHRTAGQIHRGLAGLFIVRDDEEDALALPGGDREILMVLQDRDDGAAHAFEYAPTDAELDTGILRSSPFGNGVRLPSINVTAAQFRFRILNASQARVYRIAADNGLPLVIVGNDGGLLPGPVTAESIYLGVGERIDLLIDFAATPAGRRIILKSLAFDFAGPRAESFPQGMEMDLLELVRVDSNPETSRTLPAVLSSIPPLGAPGFEREFVLRSSDRADAHQINGLSYDMNRIDERIPLGQIERWIFRNDSDLPHPVHGHGTQFQIESRVGGRNAVYPYERGWKDTALVMPLETVSVLIRFDAYRGVFPMHCHNLQHEDSGMMLNVEVI
jgi:FtsP/CotA-like multicopper oxidase with cupredoxin domain